jgi:hypothetical protein
LPPGRILAPSERHLGCPSQVAGPLRAAPDAEKTIGHQVDEINFVIIATDPSLLS